MACIHTGKKNRIIVSANTSVAIEKSNKTI